MVKLLQLTAHPYGVRREIQVLATNPLEQWRWETWLDKEPETIAWIESRLQRQPQPAFIDVGANVGVYSVYAALAYQVLWEARPRNYPNLLLALDLHPANVAAAYKNLDTVCYPHPQAIVAGLAPVAVGNAWRPRIVGRLPYLAGYSEDTGPVAERFRDTIQAAKQICHYYEQDTLYNIVSHRLPTKDKGVDIGTVSSFAVKIDVEPGQAVRVLDGVWNQQGTEHLPVDSVMIEVNSDWEARLVERVAADLGLRPDERINNLPRHSRFRRAGEKDNTAVNLAFSCSD